MHNQLNHQQAIFHSDLPGPAELVVEDPAALVKGGEVLLTCNLDDAGKPEAQHFLWTKSVIVLFVKL